MRGALAWSLVVLAVGSIPGSLLVSATEPDTAAVQPRFTTRLDGTVPDLVGRWLVVTQIRSGRTGAGGNGAAQLWDIDALNGKPQLTVRDVRLPPALQADLDAANQARRDWEPGVREFRELRDAWSTLPAFDRGVAGVETLITGKDAFSDAIRTDAQMRGANFVIQMTVAFAPGPNRPIKDVLLFGATAPTPFGHAGNFASATIAPSPIPIPIVLQGVFRLYRLDSVPTRGVLARVVDAFAGCGRGSTSGAGR